MMKWNLCGDRTSHRCELDCTATTIRLHANALHRMYAFMIFFLLSLTMFASVSHAETLYRKPITIDHNQVTYDGAFQFYFKMEDADYPVGIDFNKQGKDIFFTDSTGNDLPFERVQNINGNVKAGLVLDVGSSGSFDSTHVLPGTVLKEDGTYKMWYSGTNDSNRETNLQIGYATSPDGINWTRNGTTPVLPMGGINDWDHKGVQGNGDQRRTHVIQDVVHGMRCLHLQYRPGCGTGRDNLVQV